MRKPLQNKACGQTHGEGMREGLWPFGVVGENVSDKQYHVKCGQPWNPSPLG